MSILMTFGVELEMNDDSFTKKNIVVGLFHFPPTTIFIQNHRCRDTYFRRHELHKRQLDNVVAVTEVRPSLRQTRTQAEGETHPGSYIQSPFRFISLIGDISTHDLGTTHTCNQRRPTAATSTAATTHGNANGGDEHGVNDGNANGEDDPARTATYTGGVGLVKKTLRRLFTLLRYWVTCSMVKSMLSATRVDFYASESMLWDRNGVFKDRRIGPRQLDGGGGAATMH
ncbi:hypothetical protein JHK82_047995 [Glycine max]|nr:hypothetical protein JHK82_047995 [Glycine max]